MKIFQKNLKHDIFTLFMKIFDNSIMSGESVARYYRKSSLDFSPHEEKIRITRFKKVIIDYRTAMQYRHFTDMYGYGKMINSKRMSDARERFINYYSLLKYPPIVRDDGLIWDGNHRLERAIELKLPKIPVLKEFKIKD